MGILGADVFDAAMDEIRDRSKKALYQRDFLAWASDVLGRRYYEFMAGIAVEIATPSSSRTRTAVKSANGCGKSFLLTDIGTWWVTAFPPEESLAIFTANGRQQIQTVIFKYLKDNYGYISEQAKAGNGAPPIGWISEQLEWNYKKPDGSGKEAIAFGKRPADQDIVSSFQGTRKRRTFVGLDEMGGLPEDILTAAEAVTTGDESRIAGIGNPDRRGTMFYDIFYNSAYAAEWNRYTISGYDLPTMTGEVVYPDEPEKEAALRGGLNSAAWIAHKERVWMTGGELSDDPVLVDKHGGHLVRRIGGKPDARFKAKVLGEFPDEDDRAFFSESIIVKSFENDIDPGIDAPVLGVDLAAEGDDESVVYVNRNGNIRLFDQTIRYQDGDEERETTGIWAKEDEVTSARRVHAIAKYTGAREVRLDAAGLGHGIAVALERYDEFSDGNYDVIQVIGSNQSSDRDAWANNRAENHDALRYQMRDGTIDLDPADTILRDQLLTVTYELNNRGAVQITPKKDMRSGMHGSPDRLDACIYAALDTSPLTSNPLGGMEKGDMVTRSAWELLRESRDPAMGYPL